MSALVITERVHRQVMHRWGLRNPDAVQTAVQEVIDLGVFRLNRGGLPMFDQQYKPYLRRIVVLHGPEVLTVYTRATDAYRAGQRAKRGEA